MRPTHEIDAVWAKVCKLLTEGRLHFAKVSTARLSAASGKETHVICVYTTDWEDLEEVARVRAVLLNAGVSEELGYKRDLETMTPNPDFEFIYRA